MAETLCIHIFLFVTAKLKTDSLKYLDNFKKIHNKETHSHNLYTNMYTFSVKNCCFDGYYGRILLYFESAIYSHRSPSLVVKFYLDD